MGLMAVAMVWLGCDAWRGGKVSPAASEQRTATSQQGLINFATILGAVAAYALLAETMGFLLLASIILWLMLLRLGTRPLLSGFIVVLFVPSVYFAFAFLLRVPLPRGWLG
jgi:putative tricarboxylic transport membrane protein